MAPSAEEKKQIQELIDQVNIAGARFLDNDDASARAKLSDLSNRLALAAQNPADAQTKLEYRPYQTAVIRTCLALDLFTFVPEDGSSISIQELAKTSGCDEDLLRRLVRVLPPIGILESRGVDRYCHTPLSRRFTKQSQAAMFSLIFGELSTLVHMPEFFRQTAYGTNPQATPYKSPWQFANATTLAYFEWLQTQPEKLAIFNSAMPAFSEQHNRIDKVYPFDKVLEAAIPEGNAGRVAIVDVGGGNGQVVQDILQTHPLLQGRMIVQDLANMLITTGTTNKRIEFMEHDFFQPQPIRGAQIYFFSHVFHDWSDDDCRRILKPTVEAMDRTGSRIVISDMVLEASHPTEQETLMDLLMMTVGGGERSEKQWEQLLKSAGLGLVKFWTAADGSVIEAMVG